MKRRILLIVVITGILGVIAGGIWLYLRQTSNPKILARAELALQANQPQKALELAITYVSRNPDSWNGHFLQARACMLGGRFEEARPPLEKALTLAPSELVLVVALSETWSFPARKLLAARDTADQPVTLQKTIADLQEANRILGQAKAVAGKEADWLRVQESLGLNAAAIASAHRSLGARMEREAHVAEVAGLTDVGSAKRQAASQATQEAQKAEDSAVQTLLAVVQQDARSSQAGRDLIQLCIRRGDEQTIQTVRSCIMGLAEKDRPPIATMLLAMHEVAIAQSAGIVQTQQKIKEAATQLDSLLRDHGDEMEVKLSRAQLALMQSDWDTAETLCQEILKKDALQGQAGLYHAKALMGRGRFVEAERELNTLKARYPQWAEAQFTYAQAALLSGKREPAHEALRAVTKLAGRAGQAHRLLAEAFLKEGYYEVAFEDAKAFYDEQPDNPDAIRLFSEAARLTDRMDIACKAFETGLEAQRDRADVLVAFAAAYARMGKADLAIEIARRAEKIKPESEESYLGVGLALAMLNRASEAQSLFAEGLASHPLSPRLHHELAGLLAKAGKGMQAMDHYRTAVSLDHGNTTYRLELSKTMLVLGMVEAADEECRQVLAVEPANAAAIILNGRIKALLGQKVDLEQMLGKSGKGPLAGLPLAIVYLSQGDGAKCVEICLGELKRTPDDPNVLFLLARAYLTMNQPQDCIGIWKRLVRAAPGDSTAYWGIANLMIQQSTPQGIRRTLEEIPSANLNVIDLVMGQLYRQLRDHVKAAESYGALASRSGAPEDQRNLAALLQARSYAEGGKLDAALAALDSLSSAPTWRNEALLQKARLLVSAKRMPEAEAVLDALRKGASGNQDEQHLLGIARLYAFLRKYDLALGVCKELQQSFPRDSRPYTLQADVLAAMGKLDEAVESLENAIRQQPDNSDNYRKLARLLDDMGDLLRATEALARLESLGQMAKCISLYDQAALYKSHGLGAQSVACLEQLAQMESAGMPRVKLAMAEAFVSLNRLDQAREALKDVPKYSPCYVEAGQLLAGIAPSTDEKLVILRQLKLDKPGEVGVLVQELEILVEADRFDEAVTLFEDFARKLPEGQSIPTETVPAVLTAMVMKDQLVLAKELCLRLAKETGAARWRQLAVILASQGDPQSAVEIIGEPVRNTDLNDVLLGLSLCGGKEPQGDAWYQQFVLVGNQLSAANPNKRVPIDIKLLAALAAGKINEAKSELGSFAGVGPLGRSVASELVSSAAGDAQAFERARQLIRASLAFDLGMPVLGRTLSMKILRDYRRCQWAAALVLLTRPEQAVVKNTLEMLEPGDCPLAMMARALMLVKDSQFDKAAEVCHQAAATEQQNYHYLATEAGILESANRPSEALEIYQKILAATNDPLIANNVAYLLAETAAGDKAKLDKAQALARKVVEGNRQASAFRDTLGWVLFLSGDSQAARDLLRRSIKGLTDVPEAHYHLAMAEAACGQADLAKWHLDAAIALAGRIKSQGRDWTPALAKILTSAQTELDKLRPQK